MRRRREIDSLRGLAALAVLFYHVLATNFSAFNTGTFLGDEKGFWANLLVYTPLHIFWIGAEAVFLFFVLSGFVLTRAASKPTFMWRAYYPSRLVRLYLPVWAAVVLAYITFIVIPHHAAPQDVAALGGAPTSYPGSAVLKDLTLLTGTSNSLGTLWSLQWEVVFSLALPLCLYLVRHFAVPATVLALVICIHGWFIGDVATSYLPMFFIGALLAQWWEPISRAFAFLERPATRTHVIGALLTAASITGITSYFLLGRLLLSLGWPPRPVTVVITIAGIALLVIVVQQWTPLQRLLSTRWFVFLGTISFSLYLVHLPIVLVFAFTLHRGWLSTVLAIVVSLGVAVLFYRFIEKRAHGLSRRVANSIRRRITVEPATVDVAEDSASK